MTQTPTHDWELTFLACQASQGPQTRADHRKGSSGGTPIKLGSNDDGGMETWCGTNAELSHAAWLALRQLARTTSS